MLKAIYDKEVKTRNLVTTITGVVVAVIMFLNLFGVITPDQADELKTQSTILIDSIVNVIIPAVTAIILVFKAKDA